MLQQQRATTKSIGIDNLAKNIFNKKKHRTEDSPAHSASDLYVEKLMSAMNDNEYESASSGAAGNTNKSIGSPSSPSSLSSASSTTSSHSSSSNANAMQAVVQAFLNQQQQSQSSGMGLLTSDKSNPLHAMQQQQQLNQLLALAAQNQSGGLLNNLMQQKLEGASGKKQSAKLPKLNVKTKNQGSRSIKGNSVSPPGTSSSCSDDQEAHSPNDQDILNVKAESQFNQTPMSQKQMKKSIIKSESQDQDDDLDRSTNSSASQDLNNQTDMLHESQQQDDLEDELDDYETSFSRDSKRHRNHSSSSPTRSTSSNPHSRSTSPSTTSYHDSPAAFPALNPLESATAMLGGLNCTPGAGLSSFLDTSLGSVTDSGKKRRPGNAIDANNKKIKPVPNDKKDDAYWERRRKNNEAAKRSRDLRRQKEDEIAVKATILEQENLKLKAQVTILKAELSKLHFMLYNR